MTDFLIASIDTIKCYNISIAEVRAEHFHYKVAIK